jgi:hypothetical protein
MVARLQPVAVRAAANSADASLTTPAPGPPTAALAEPARRNLKSASDALRRLGWFSFWSQLTLSVVSTFILIFSVSFSATVRYVGRCAAGRMISLRKAAAEISATADAAAWPCERRFLQRNDRFQTRRARVLGSKLGIVTRTAANCCHSHPHAARTKPLAFEGHSQTVYAEAGW